MKTYYFFSTAAFAGISGGVFVFSVLSIVICILLLIWKGREWFSYERRRKEIEQFVVACYVDKLEKISNLVKGEGKPKKKKKKTKKKSDSESRSRHHRRHHSRSRSHTGKLPHGSKLFPIPNEKDIFASDKQKVEVKPAQIQQPQKSNNKLHSHGSNTSVCSLRSVTQS